MAWLYRRPGSDRWWIGFRQHGEQFLKSTGTSDKAEAKQQLDRIETMIRAQRANLLNNEVFAALTGKVRPQKPLKAALEEWIAEAHGSTGPRTAEKYEALAEDLVRFFKANEQGPLVDSETVSDGLQPYLAERRRTVSAETANMARKCLAVFFNRCKTHGYVAENPIDAIPLFKPGREEMRVRRPFTLEEMQELYALAPDDFWRYMLLAGFFTGLRLGDLVTMPIGAVDWQKRIISVTTRKTGKPMKIPIAAPLFQFLLKLKAERPKATPTTPFWPEQAARYLSTGSGWFGQRFYDLLLVRAGLVTARPHRTGGKTRSDRRTVNEVSFHCLRHAYVSTLAANRQNQQIVKALAGHSGDSVNDLYTTLPEEVLRDAVALLPDITSPTKTGRGRK
jgi:integrase